MRKKKKPEFQIGPDSPENTMLASLILTKYAWQVECQLQGWKVDAPLDIASVVANTSNFALYIFGLDLSNTRVGELLSDKLLLSAGLKVDQENVVDSGDPDPKVLKLLSEMMIADPKSKSSSKIGKLTLDLIKRETSRLEGKFN